MASSGTDVYINSNFYYSYYSSDNSNEGDEPCGGSEDGWSAEVRHVARFIADSPTKHCNCIFLEKTMAEISDAMKAGAKADEIYDAWDLYLDELMTKNSDGDSDAFKRYAMFPLNWFRRANGFRFYLKKIRTASGDTTEGSHDDAHEGDSECTSEAERLARKYRLTANKTTSGIIWTFTGDYHSAQLAPPSEEPPRGPSLHVPGQGHRGAGGYRRVAGRLRPDWRSNGTIACRRPPCKTAHSSCNCSNLLAVQMLRCYRCGKTREPFGRAA